MNVLLLVGGLLSALIGIVHSVPGPNTSRGGSSSSSQCSCG
jgi:hypothetical protein